MRPVVVTPENLDFYVGDGWTKVSVVALAPKTRREVMAWLEEHAPDSVIVPRTEIDWTETATVKSLTDLIHSGAISASRLIQITSTPSDTKLVLDVWLSQTTQAVQFKLTFV